MKFETNENKICFPIKYWIVPFGLGVIRLDWTTSLPNDEPNSFILSLDKLDRQLFNTSGWTKYVLTLIANSK